MTLTVSGLTIERGARTLVSGLSFAVPPGELLLLRGPNGAGKTSLLLAIAGILHPAAGTVAAGPLHLLGHQSAIKPKLTASENLSFWCALYGGDPGHIAPALQTVGLAHAADIEAGHLSAGQTRRLTIARLLVAHRDLWLLDEPTSALDSEGELLVQTLLDAHLKRGGLAVAAVHHDLHLPPPANVRTLYLREAGDPRLSA
jgi:heme exporter protein A